MCGGHYYRWKHGKSMEPPLRKVRPAGSPPLRCSIDGCDKPTVGRGWCSSHYSAWTISGDPMKRSRRSPGTPKPICTIEGCERPVYARGLCHAHEQRKRRGVPMDRPLRKYTPGIRPFPKKRTPRADLPCSYEGCDRLRFARGLCGPHHWRLIRGLPMDKPIRQVGNGSISNGYRAIVRRGHPNANPRTGMILEHRWVMSETLGRPLRPGENVHHKNGDRLDNRPENLELWLVSQPPGQRVSDLSA